MATVFTHGKMAVDTKAIITKTKNMALVYTFILTAANTVENGSMDCSMEQGASLTLKVNLNAKVSGRMANLNNGS